MSGTAAGPGAPAPRGEHLRTLGILALVLALFFSPAILTSRQFLFRDTGRMHAPTKRFLAAELARGHLPQWNRHAGLGAPYLAGAMDAVQHPFNVLLMAFPFEVGFKLWVLLSYLAAGAGGYAWTRRLGRSLEASTASGLAFALGGYLVSASDNLTYLTTLAAVPWVLAAAHDWLERGGPGRLALLGLASGLCAAGGDPQAWGFAAGALPVYALALVRDGRPARVRLGRGLAAAAAALVGAAPFVLPVAMFVPYSSRGEPFDPEDYRRWSLPWLRLLEFLVPHLFRIPDGALESQLHQTYGSPDTPAPWVLSVYPGVTVAALAGLGARREGRARLLVLGAAAAAWTALGANAGFGQLARHLPLLGGFRYWEKMAVWVGLCLAPAAAFGLERLVTEAPRLWRFAAGAGLAGAAALAAALGLALFPEGAARWVLRGEARGAAAALVENVREGLQGAGTGLLALGLATAAIRRGRLGGAAPWVVLLVVLLDLGGANIRGYTLADPSVGRPRSRLGEWLREQPGLQRVVTPFVPPQDRWPRMRQVETRWLWGGMTLEPNWCVDYGVANFDPYLGMVPDRTARFRRRIPLSRQLPNLGLWSVGWVVVPGALALAAQANLAPPFEAAAVEPLLPAYLVRVPHRPRAYLARALSSADRRAAIEFALDPSSAASDRSVVEGPLPPGYLPPQGTARIAADEAERVEIRTEADAQALLVLNDTFAPGWAATVDGRPAEILAANYLVRGVWVPAGSHRVVFRYRTPGLREGWLVLLAGALGLGAWSLASARRRPPPAPG